MLICVSFISRVGGQTAWISQDIGNPAIAGSASSTTSGFTITAGGSDIWGTSDQFHFVYQQISGDVDIRARVDSITYSSSWAKAGVMIRGSLAADAAHGFALVSAGKGTAFQRRTQAGGSSTNTAGVFAAAPEWVRLVRQGSTVSTYTSPDGTRWTLIGSDTIQLPAAAYVGLAVSSHNTSGATTASISQISVTPVGLPAGQTDADLGSPAIAGAASYSNGTYRVHAGGADIWGTADQFNYVYQPITGDVDVSVRINSITYADKWSKAGVMIRETLTPGSAHASAFVSAGRGYAFQRRPVAGGTSVNTAGTSGAPPGWLRLTRSGDLITAYQSSDGKSWTAIGSDSIPMASTVYVGIAATSHNTSSATDVSADSLSITQTGTNQPPTVSISSPATGASFTAPATIPIAANAADPENQLTKVEFYSGTTLLGTATASPYSFSWSSVPAGSYSLTAVAYDAAGASTRSAPVSVTVGAATNQPPTVSVSSPANGATFTAPASITIAANASDPENQLTKVEFYNGTTLLGTDTTSPYSLTWSSVPAGTYTLTAVAYDAGGLNTRSAPVGVTVSATNQAPAVTLTAPANGASYVTPASISLAASASDADGTVAKVEFYAGTTLLGTDTSAPYTYTWASNATPAAIALVQHAGLDAGTADSASLAFPAANTAGRWIAVAIRAASTGQVFTVRDSSGNAYRKAVQLDETTDGTSLALYYAENIAGGTNTVTVSKSITGGTLRMAVFEYSGVATSGSLDAVAAARGTSTAPSSGAVTTAGAGELALGVITTANGPTMTAGSGFTLQEGVPATGPKLGVEDTIEATAGSVTAGATLATSDAWGALIAAFRPASTGTQGPAPGTYVLKAVAYDNAGASTNSATATITITSGNQPPIVSVSSPANGATFTAPASITIAASASDPENQLTKVEFYSGSTLLGTDTTSPYSLTWSSVPAGSYSLTAVAYDAAGASTRSAVVSVTVSVANQPPTAAITSPVSGASFTAPASITIAASASDPENQLTKVEFYSGSTLLGTDTTSPYSLTWSSVPAGSYSLTAVAYDAAGASTRSAAVSVTVTTSTSTVPTAVTFTASTDNATVTSYRIDVFAATADPNTATPVASLDAGKPTPDANNDITVSASSFFSALAPGNYQLTVSAISAGGTGRSAPVAFTR